MVAAIPSRMGIATSMSTVSNVSPVLLPSAGVHIYQRRHNGQSSFNGTLGIEGNVFNVHFSRFEFGTVEEIINDTHECHRCRFTFHQVEKVMDILVNELVIDNDNTINAFVLGYQLLGRDGLRASIQQNRDQSLQSNDTDSSDDENNGKGGMNVDNWKMRTTGKAA
jgi:hypothetical protein